MITQTESGFPVALYNAINAGGMSTELRVTQFSPDLLPLDTLSGVINVLTQAGVLGVTKIVQLENNDYAIQDGGKLWVSDLSAYCTLLYASGVVDFCQDATNLYVFHISAANYVRATRRLSDYNNTANSTIIANANVNNFACADKDTVFYLKPTNNNGNFARAIFNGSSWSETVSSLWFFLGGIQPNNFQLSIPIRAQKTDTDKWVVVLRLILPGELATRTAGSTTYQIVETDIQFVSIVVEGTGASTFFNDPSIIYEYVAESNRFAFTSKNHSTVSLSVMGDYLVFNLFSLAGLSHKISVSKDGFNWSYLVDSNVTLGVDKTNRPISLANEGLSVGWRLRTYKKSPRLYGYANCDAGVNVTSQIIVGSWQFEQSGVMQINMRTTQDLGYSLFRHELGWFWDGNMYWHTYATTQTDTVVESYTVVDGKTEYAISTRDGMAWLIDRFQSSEGREWNGHQASFELFTGKATKMAVTAGSLTFGSDATGPFGTVLVPVIANGRAHVNFTGMEDKRNHCQAYWVQPQGASSFAHLFSIFHPTLSASTGVWLNVTTANIQLRGWHNNVNVMNPPAIVVANAQYFRIQLHYGLLRIYYSTNNINWTVVNYPLNYTGMRLWEFTENTPVDSPWAVSYPGIGAFGTGSSARFRTAINTNRNKPILLADAVKIAGAYGNIHDTKIEYGKTGDVFTGAFYVEGLRTGALNIGYVFQGGSLIQSKIIETAGLLALEVLVSPLSYSQGAPNSRIAYYASMLTTGEVAWWNPLLDSHLEFGTVWNGEEIITTYRSGFSDQRTRETQKYRVVNLSQDAMQIIPIPIPVLTVDPGESPDQGLSRAFQGRDYLSYFLRRTGELWVRPSVKIHAGYVNSVSKTNMATVLSPYAVGVNLVSIFDQKTQTKAYDLTRRNYRVITADSEFSYKNPNGEEGTFEIIQNALIDNPTEYAGIVLAGNGLNTSYQCEVPVFQELFDPIEDGTRITSISGALDNGQLSGTVVIGNKELVAYNGSVVFDFFNIYPD